MAWLGAMPLAANALAQAPAQEAPFVWGAGGARMTPEEIAFQRQLAAQQQQIDYSPVGHWLQGAARVAGNVGGALRERRADRASQANASEAEAVARALMGGGGPQSSQTAAEALINPYIPESVRGIAKMQYDRANPKPQAPTEFERLMVAAGIQPGTPEWVAASQRALQSRTDPLISIPLPGDRMAVGPRSLVEAEIGSMRGGGPASTGQAGALPPSTLPSDFAFPEAPMTPDTAAPVLGGAARNNVITRAQAQAIRSSLGKNGQAAFEAWLRKNKITIGAE